MTDERRKYFRVQDTIELGFRRLETEELADPEMLLGKGEELDNVEKELAMLMINLQSKHADLLRVLELLNRKIDFVHHSVDHGGSRLDMTHEYEMRQVDISGCGAAFPVADHLAADEKILLQINLPAPYRSVRAIARVISCKTMQKEAGVLNHMVRVDFDHMIENDQEILIQYLMKRQVLELKARRKARDGA